MIQDTQQQIDPKVLDDIRKRLKKWKIGANLLSGLFIAIGLISIICSVFVSAFIGIMDDNFIRIIAVIGTILFTAINAFNLKIVTSNVRNGWKHLNAALYRYDSKQIDDKKLVEEYEKAENMLGTVEFNINKSKED